jgi:hypothetical protein
MLSRREFIRSLLAAGVGGTALLLGAPGCSSPEAAAGPRGGDPPAAALALPRATLEVLMAAAEGLAGVRPLRGHYARYFEYRAKNVRGYAALYESFAAEVRRRRPDFLAADLDARLEVLDRLRYHGATGELAPPARGGSLEASFAAAPAGFSAELTEDALRSIRFERYVLQEILVVFANTDGLLALGYRSWPGGARGLEEHLHPPA